MRIKMKEERMMRLQIRSDRMEEVEGMRSEYPYVYHPVDLRRTPVPWHWHEAVEFGFVREGTMQVSTAGQTRTFQTGEGFFINSNVLTAMACDGPCVLDSHLFHPVLLGGHFHSVYEIKYLNPVLQNRGLDLLPIDGRSRSGRELLQRLRQLAALQAEEDREFQTRNMLSEIWLQLLLQLRETPVRTEPGRNQERMLTMMAFIHEHYAEKLILEQIADAAAVSTRECLRCFRSTIGQSPMEYLISYRVQAAAKLLERTDLPVTRIAMETGWSSSSYFAKMFRQHSGQTPNAYRKERKHRT
jgi:AraC-like DNA-binding protein